MERFRGGVMVLLSLDVLLTDWSRRVRENQCAHYACAKRYGNLNRFFGIPTIALTATVGTTVFATLETGASGKTRVVLGVLSVAAAALASLQTFMSFAELADKHRAAGANYGAIRRDLDLLKTFPRPVEMDVETELRLIKGAMDKLAISSPHIPSTLKTRTDKSVNRSIVFQTTEEQQRYLSGKT